MGTHKFVLCPCSESDYFYSVSNGVIEQRCIGHLRMDFGDGNEFHTTWWPHTAHECNNASFKEALDGLVNQLRRNLFKSRASMYKYLSKNPGALLESKDPRAYGYCVHTDKHSFYIRCTPERGNYNGYIYCYLREASCQ